MLWPPDGKNLFIGKDADAGKDWRQEEQGTTEDEMAGWHHWLNLHEFEQAPGVGDGQGSLLCCSPWGSKVLDMTERLTWTGFRHKKEGALPLWQHGWTVKILWKWKSLSRVRLFVIHGLYSPWILQARIVERAAIRFSRGSSQTDIKPRSPALQANSLPAGPPGKPKKGDVVAAWVGKMLY